jgi:hypothetical protein
MYMYMTTNLVETHVDLIGTPPIYIQLNLVVSNFTGPLQNFELSEFQLKESKVLSKTRNSVR